MTLYRQLIIFTLVLFLLLFTGSWYAKFESTRSFLIDQLTSHAQDTATSLGLSVSPHVAEKDMATVEGMINAVFDRGYYEVIRYSDIQGKPVIERKLKVKIEDVPKWFINVVPLETPEASANIMSGWRQAGSIYVKSHPGYAYNTLWNDVVKMTLWFFACGIFVLVGGGAGIRILLKPLDRVERQADALCRKEYEIQEKLPWTRELRRVVQAMNRMTIKIKEMFEEQIAQAESLRERAYYDVLTGLGNRRFFESQVNAVLGGSDAITKGILALVRISDLIELNQQKGFQAGDEILKRIGTLLQESFGQRESVILARLTGGDFAVFMAEALPWEADELAQTMANHLRQIASEKLSLTDCAGHTGIAVFNETITLSRLLAEADAALATALLTGPNAWNIKHLHAGEVEMPLGQQKWKEMLESALNQSRVSLDIQPVVKTINTQELMHIEVLSRIIQENGETLNAGIFMPFAERLKLVPRFDRIVLDTVMKMKRTELGVEKIAVNMSPLSLHDAPFWQWLEPVLSNYPAYSPKLVFEFSEFNVVQNLSAISEFSAFVKKHGHDIALDHYGQSFSHLGYLKSIRPDYVKIDKAYTAELKEEGSDARFYIASLCSVAHSIDIMVVAEGVETEQQKRILTDLNVDALQGYLFGKPQSLKSYLSGIK
ncbi:MAG: EAL domain-containing protein [Syntrophaceae bacterium]|nr:EAL domain-containing protein [Syntrophaceae bacterium]